MVRNTAQGDWQFVVDIYLLRGIIRTFEAEVFFNLLKKLEIKMKVLKKTRWWSGLSVKNVLFCTSRIGG